MTAPPFYDHKLNMRWGTRECTVYYTCASDKASCAYCGCSINNAESRSSFAITEIDMDYQTINLNSVMGKKVAKVAIKVLEIVYSKMSCQRSKCLDANLEDTRSLFTALAIDDVAC